MKVLVVGSINDRGTVDLSGRGQRAVPGSASTKELAAWVPEALTCCSRGIA